MPIAPHFRRYYGPAWRQYRETLIAIARRGDGTVRCTKCQEPVSGRRLQVAHVTHDPRRPDLVCIWCAACHASNDAPHRLAVWRRNRAKRVGQLWLLPELEYAPFPAWMIPKRVIEGMQGRMFEP